MWKIIRWITVLSAVALAVSCTRADDSPQTRSGDDTARQRASVAPLGPRGTGNGRPSDTASITDSSYEEYERSVLESVEDPLLRERLENFDAEIPRVGPRLKLAVEDIPTRIAECVRDQGYEATPTRDGSGIRFGEVPSEQAASFTASAAACRWKFPLPEEFGEPLSETQIRFVYRHLIDEYIPCLERNGYDLPDTPPAEDAWVEQYNSGEAWDPITHLLETNQISRDNEAEEVERLYAECPRPTFAEIQAADER